MRSHPSGEDYDQINRWMDWTAGHTDPPADPSNQQTFLGFLQALVQHDAIADYGWNEFYAIGVVWGECLRRKHGWSWIIIEDENGRDFALTLPDDQLTGRTNTTVFPGAMVAKRVDRRDDIDLAKFEAFLLDPPDQQEPNHAT